MLYSTSSKMYREIAADVENCLQDVNCPIIPVPTRHKLHLCLIPHCGAEAQTTVVLEWFCLCCGLSSCHCCIAVWLSTVVIVVCHGEWWERRDLSSRLTPPSLRSYSGLPFIKHTHTPSASGAGVRVHVHRCIRVAVCGCKSQTPFIAN